MEIDWVHVGEAIGHQSGGGTTTAQRALEHLLGNDAIDAAVDLVLTLEAGWEVAESVLVHLQSQRALERAYAIYKAASGERKQLAVWLIKNLHLRDALAWVPEFLADPEVAGRGMEVLDTLLFAGAADPETEEVETLLLCAERHADEGVPGWVAHIRAYLRRDSEIAALQRAYYDAQERDG